MMSPALASAQTRRSTPRRGAATSKADDKSSAELNAARQQVSAQIKALSHFLYLYGGIAKGMESAAQETASVDGASAVIEQNERSKAKVRESIRGVLAGLDKLEADFSSSLGLRKYYHHVIGVAKLAEAAESQVASNRFDEAGRSLLKAVGQLADALAAMR